MDKYIGKLLDNRYEMLEILGVGGMAVVYKARDRVLDRFVAIKIMKDEFSNDEEFRKRFRNESQAVAKLSHNNIVSIFDVSSPNSPVQYIVMELIEGITLKNYLQRKGSLSWQETLFFAQQISKALSHAHSRGIIHQDIKPHNIILLRDGTVKVTDFGIARFEKNQETRVIQEAIGSVHYISPEQAKGSRIDHRADLYSLGVVMYEMLTGRVPFDGDTPIAIVMQHINAQAPLPSELVPGIPRGMDDIVMRAMCPTLSQRYASADDIYNDLERLKNNPNLRFSSAGTDARAPGGGRAATDETIALPRMNRQQRVSPAPQSRSFDDPQPQDQVYRPNQKPQQARSVPADRGRYPEDEDDRRVSSRRKKKKKRSLSDSPAAMAGIAVAVFVLIAAAVAFFMMQAGNLFSSSNLQVPNLVGMQYEDAIRQYGSDFIIEEGQRRTDEDAEDGEILDQTPDAQTNAEKNSVITVVVCDNDEDKTSDSGDVVILDESIIGGIVGEDYQSVENKLTGLGLEVHIEHQNDQTIEKDHVISISPSLGSEVRKGDSVYLYVSDGPEAVALPNVVGKDISAAREELAALNFTSINTSEEYNDAPEGQVFRQSPDAGEEIMPDTSITLYISKGPEEEDTSESERPDEQPTEDETPPSRDPEQNSSEDPEQSGSASGGDVGQGDGSYEINIPINAQNSVSLTVELGDGTILHSGPYDPSNGTFTQTVHGPVGKSETVKYYINGNANSFTFMYR